MKSKRKIHHISLEVSYYPHMKASEYHCYFLAEEGEVNHYQGITPSSVKRVIRALAILAKRK